SMMRAPVWKRSQSITAGAARNFSSSQTGVSWSHNVSAIAATPATSGGGGATGALSRATVPGRAVASSTARDVDCAPSPGSENAAATISALAPHQREELDLGGRRLLRPHRARRVDAAADRREHDALENVAALVALHERVAIGDQLRLGLIASEHVAEADLAGRELDRRARPGRLAEIERRAVAADPPAHHDEAAFGLADLPVRRQRPDAGEETCDLRRRALGKHGHGGAAKALQIASVRTAGLRHVWHFRVVYVTRQLVGSADEALMTGR